MTDRCLDVVVNNRNYGRYVGTAVESALDQRDVCVHVVVVDDGSDDDSLDVLDSYSGDATVVTKPWGGQASAVNAGWALCTSRVVVFLDADDVLLPGIGARLVDAFGASPDLAKVQYRMVVIDEAGRQTGELRPGPHRALPSGRLVQEELTFPFDLPWMATSGNAFPRWVLERILPMPEEEYRLGADWYLRHLAALYGPVLSFDDPGAGYRVHGSNNYERAVPGVDLGQVRQTVAYAAATRRHLAATAAALGLPMPAGDILSVADLANRLISLRLSPQGHPVATDTRPGLVTDGIRAAVRRWDVGPARKGLFAAWFLAMATAPRPLAMRFAEAFLAPRRDRGRRAVTVVVEGGDAVRR